jgi:hypothetical protein
MNSYRIACMPDENIKKHGERQKTKPFNRRLTIPVAEIEDRRDRGALAGDCCELHGKHVDT